MASSKQYSQLPATLETYYKQAPMLPVGFRDVLVQIAPWLAIIFGVLGLLFGLMGVLGGTVLTGVGAFAGAAHYGFAAVISSLGLLVSSALLVAAFTGLQKRSMVGWNRLFWSEVVGVLFALVADVVTISIGGIIWSLVIAAIALYFIFQIKSYYK